MYNWLMQICYLHNFTLVKEVCDSKILFLLHREEQVYTVRIIYRYNQFFTVLASEKRHKFNATTWMSLRFWQSLSLPWERSLVNFRAFHDMRKSFVWILLKTLYRCIFLSLSCETWSYDFLKNYDIFIPIFSLETLL